MAVYVLITERCAQECTRQGVHAADPSKSDLAKLKAKIERDQALPIARQRLFSEAFP